MSQISRTFNGGDSCTISATASAHYHFVNWTENGVEITKLNPYTFTVDSDRTITGNFAINSYNITTSVNPSNGGSVSGGGSYNHGATVSLTATAASGYAFVGWYEDSSRVNTSNPLTFTATQDRSIVAKFTPTYTIQVSYDNAQGSVSFVELQSEND